MTKEEIIKQHSITEEEKMKIAASVESIITLGKTPVENPVCVIIGGQCGSGKSGLMAYSSKMFPDYNVIMLEDDGLRHYYPNEQQISVDYPDEYIAITNQLTNGLTSYLFNKLADQHYNLIFHQTLKNNRIADEGIEMLRQKGYSIVVRGLAVSDFESRMSMINRCLGQLSYNGFCRFVTTADHDNTYNGMPNTLQYIEDQGKYDVLEVFQRGEKPDEPIVVYARMNPDRKDKVNEILSHPNVSFRDIFDGYPCVRDAVVTTRKKDREFFMGTYERRYLNAINDPSLNAPIKGQIFELDAMIREYEKSKEEGTEGQGPNKPE